MTNSTRYRAQFSSCMPVRHRGFTLVELLISMVLGIVVIGALVVVYTSGSAASRNAQAQSQMNEDAQMAMAVITNELRQAGYNPMRPANGVGFKTPLLDASGLGWTLRACDTGFKDNTKAISALECNTTGSSTSLAVVYEGDLYSGKNTGTPKPMDCIGTGVDETTGAPPESYKYYIMQSRLFIKDNALNCTGGGDLTQSQILAENIESMTVNFAIGDPSTNTTPQLVVGYLNASDIATVTTAADWTDATPHLLTEPERWNKVVAARVCIVVMSENTVLNELGSSGSNPTYTNCSNVSTDITDGKLRRAYRTTVLLRNHGVGYV